jgi:hypothetical protein
MGVEDGQVVQVCGLGVQGSGEGEENVFVKARPI